MAICQCGCGRRLFGTGRKWFDPKKCRHRFLVDAVRYGLLPLGELKIGTCSYCKEEMLYHRTYPTKTCTQYSTGNCNRKLHSKKMSTVTIKKYNTKRPAYLAEYCHQSWLECAEYSNCGGKYYTGKCFVGEKQTSGTQGISSECKVNMPGSFR